MRRRNRLTRRGIFLISVLFIVVLISMFVGASFELVPWAFRRSMNEGEVAAAHRAARSGISYALARLKVDPTWRAAGPKETIVNETGLIVVEEQGNVFGLVTQNGSTSQFRLRFNYQDGSMARDNLPDVASAAHIDYPLVCFNNLTGSMQAEVPKADGAGFVVPASPTIHTVVPARAVYLVCEGRTGDWLRSADATNPNPPAGAFGTVSTARIETVYKVNNIGQTAVTPAVAATADQFKATLPAGSGTVELDSADNSVLGRLRSRQDFDFTGGALKNLTAGPGKYGEYRHVGSSNVNNATNVAQVAEDSTASELYRIGWGQVNVADGTNKIRGGVYSVWQDGTLHYYDMTMADYKALMAGPDTAPGYAGTAPVLPASVNYDPTTKKFTVSGDTLVDGGPLATPPSVTADLIITPKKGADAGDGSGGGLDSAALEAALVAPSPLINTGSPPAVIYSGSLNALMNAAASASPPLGTFTGGDWYPYGLSGVQVKNLSSSNAELEDSADRAQLVMALQELVGDGRLAPNHPGLLALGVVGGGSGGPLGEIPAVLDTTTPQDVLVSFEPGIGTSSAVLSGPGNVTVGAQVKGNGGSITAEGDINLVGLGVDLAAATNPNEGVSLYSKKDILISTFDKANAKYHDVGLKGVVYNWGNLTAILGSSTVSEAEWGTFQLNGTLVAYGKDPDDLTAPISGGKFKLTAKDAKMKFDSSYLLGVMNDAALAAAVSQGGFGRVWWLQD